MVDNLAFYKETEFKDTEIGKIPKEWDRAFLGEVSDVIMGQSPPSDTYNRLKIGLPFLQGSAEFGQIHPEPTVYCADPIKIAKAGDLLISVRAPVGDVNLSNSAYCIGRGIAAVRPKETQFDTRFGFYYLKYSVKRLSSLGSGSTFKAIRREELVRFLLALPPVTEQKQIATILSTIDEAIQKTDELIAKTERLKKGMMQELLTKGIGHKEFKDTEIGRIPKEWEVVKLKDIMTYYKGKKPLIMSTKNKTEYVPYLSAEYLRTNTPQIFVYPDENNIIINEGDLILIWDGSNAGEFFYAKKGVLSSTMAKLELNNNNVDKKFLFYLLKINEDLIKNQTKGTGIPHVDKNVLENILITLPSLEEQKKIASIISSIDYDLEQLRKEREKLEKIKRGLMDELLSGRIRVRGLGQS